MHESDLPIRRRVVQARSAPEVDRSELWHRRLAWGIPVVALFAGLVGTLAILGPPFQSPSQGVRRVEPAPPPSSSAPVVRVHRH